jgi:uncharacterized membrane protein HdeD (DUF308 family)
MDLEQKDRDNIVAFRSWTMFAGILQIILGLTAISLAWATSIVTTVVIGWFVLIRGIIDLVQAFRSIRKDRLAWRMTGSILTVVIGALLASRPVAALTVLTLLISALFIVIGLNKIISAFIERFNNWVWVALSGAVSLALGFMILAQWPASSLFIIGVIVGVEFIAHGFSLTVISTAVRSDEKPVSGEGLAHGRT